MASYHIDSSLTSCFTVLDNLEYYASEQGWSYRREEHHELILQCQKRHCFYGLYFHWLFEKQTLQFSCIPDMKVPKQAQLRVQQLLSHMNNYLWIGYMGIDEDSGIVSYRHTAFLSAKESPFQNRHVEEVIQTALQQCERFYPALQMVIWGGYPVQEALTTIVLETKGQA